MKYIILRKLTELRSIIVFLVLVFILYLTLLPVEQRWAESNLVLAWAMPIIALITIPCFFFRRRFIKVTITDLMICTWLLYYIFRIWFGGEYPCATLFLKSIMIFTLYFILRFFFTFYSLKTNLLIYGLLICGGIEACWGMIQLYLGASHNSQYLLSGNFQNPGPYSAYLSMAIIIGLVMYQQVRNQPTRNRSKNIIIISTICCLIIIPATWSRAALVTLCILALWIYRHYYWKYRYAVWSVIVILSFIFYFIKRGSAEGRLLIWIASLTSWTHNPWIGKGIGGFNHACSEGFAEFYAHNQGSSLFHSAGVTDYAYNDLLRILIEQGIVGISLCIIVIMLVMIHLHKHSQPLFYALLALLVFSMFSYPFELLPYQLITVLTAAWVETHYNNAISLRIQRKKIIFIIFINIAASMYLLTEINQRIQTDKAYRSFSGLHHEAFIKDYYELYPKELDNPRFLFDFGLTLRNAKRYRDSNAILQNANKVSCDPIFCVLIGNNYSDLYLYKQAEKAYKKAYTMMPNRIYPLYQLMKMYKKSGQHTKAEKMAKKLIGFHPKIESPATEEIKKESKKIFKEYK